MRRDEWRTAAGSLVRLVEDRSGVFIVCEGCPRPLRVTGVGTASAAARKHARTCRR